MKSNVTTNTTHFGGAHYGLKIKITIKNSGVFFALHVVCCCSIIDIKSENDIFIFRAACIKEFKTNAVHFNVDNISI